MLIVGVHLYFAFTLVEFIGFRTLGLLSLRNVTLK
jgi:hypothetical protein